MSIVLTTLMIGLFFLLGILMALTIGVKNRAEVLGLSFILSSLWITITTVLLHQFFGFTINAQLFFGVLVLSISILLLALGATKKLRVIKLSKIDAARKLKSLNKPEKLVLTIIGILIFGSLFQNLFWPVTDWDALALYDFRARIVTETGSFELGKELGYFFQYPPYTSLLHTSVYVLGFEQAKLWYTILYGSFIAVFYALLRKRTSRIISLSGALLLAANPHMVEHSVMAYTNLAYILYFSLGIIYLWDWLSESRNSSLMLGGILVGGSTWVRMSEPFWIVGIALIIFGVLIKKKTSKTLFLSLFSAFLLLGIKKVWPDFMAHTYASILIPVETAQTSSDSGFYLLSLPLNAPIFDIFKNLSILLKPGVELWSRTIGVLDYFKVYILPVFSYLVMPGVFVIWYDLSKDKKRAIIEWGTVAMLIGLIFLGTLIFSFSDSSWDQIGGSAQRMSFFLIPLILYPLAASSIWNKIQKKLLA
jgi:hypothetical protein